MDDRNAQVGWTDAQWNRVREEVLREWQRVRVAGSFLPVYGPLPPSTQVVPSEVIGAGGKVDDAATSRIYELSTPLTLTRQQVREEDISGALLVFRRAATALALDEDDVLFNGQTPDGVSVRASLAPNVSRFPAVIRSGAEPPTVISTLEQYFLAQQVYERSARLGLAAFVAAPGASPDGDINPGPLGLVAGAVDGVIDAAASPSDLVTAVADAIAQIEANGYGPPFVGVLSRTAFVDAHTPSPGSLVLPADRIEPLLGRELLRASALDSATIIAPASETRGIVLSLAGDAVDLAMALEATPEFTQINDEGKYVFRVFERFALRIKDGAAIMRLEIQPPTTTTAWGIKLPAAAAASRHTAWGVKVPLRSRSRRR